MSIVLNQLNSPTQLLNYGDMTPVMNNDNREVNTFIASLAVFNYWFRPIYMQYVSEKLIGIAIRYEDAVKWIIEEEIETSSLRNCAGHDHRMSPYVELYTYAHSIFRSRSRTGHPFIEMTGLIIPMVYGDALLHVKVERNMLWVSRNQQF